MYVKNILLLALYLALCACAGSVPKPDHLTVHQRYESACVGAGTAYGIIAKVNDLKPLKKAQQEQVLKAVAITDDRCKLAPKKDGVCPVGATCDYPYTATEAVMAELEGAADTLKSIQGEVQ